MTDPTFGEPTLLTHESSTIAASAYYPDHELLTLSFHRGPSYSYRPVPYLLYLELTEAESIGKAFNTTIKNNAAIGCVKGPASEFPL